ncbi:precorrin-6A synthase (deacetylating) [Pseudomonas sp. RIT-PI-S]|uniref:precorrin-6A synthase (deacetylating) n=1 Tax=Pseudomonas sp. RIT-PI-S TaxID=3035295 RepID=UPI0021DA1EFC|nr:precorrin-6A synthase (deacetylating) [Pseudomonas sp. RIT-PI-S]
MKTLLLIGIGAGHPDHLTVQAIKALNRAEVIFLMDKGPAKEPLNRLRRELCERYLTDRPYRLVEAPSPERQRAGIAYLDAVEHLNADKQQRFEQLIAEALDEGQCGAFLVWGDPCLYDSTSRILDAILRSGRLLFEYEVIPGISSVQALAARHKVPLNNIGQPVMITPGRRLTQALAAQVDSLVVMLDADNRYQALVDQDLEIYWGAYVGTPDEILVSGRLGDVAEEIERVRTQAREAKGWIMDTYLLKRPARR